jgi:hypothetical protein
LTAFAAHDPAPAASVRFFLPLACTLLREPYLLTGVGDVIKAFDFSDALASLPSSLARILSGEAKLLDKLDAHQHDVTALRSVTDVGGMAVQP